MWESVFSNRLTKKFPVFSTVRVLTNSGFTTARYWTLVQTKWIPSVLSLRIYWDLCLVLILSPFLARFLRLSPSFKVSDEINVRITRLCYSYYMKSPWLFSWYCQVYHLQLVVTWCTASFNIKKLCILPAQCICIILWFLEQRANISLHH